MSRTTFLLLALVFITGLLLRVQYLRLAEGQTLIVRDAKQYVDYGRNLFKHGVFSKDTAATPPRPDSFRSPGYPLLIALIMGLGGETHFIAPLLYTQAALSALLVPLTYFAGVVFLPPIAALAAAFLVAVSPHLVTAAGCVLTETLFAVLLLAGVCCLQYAYKLLSIWRASLAGLLFGCAILTNEAAFFLPFFLVVGLFSRAASGAGPFTFKKMRTAAFFLSIAMLFPLGWTVRNHLNVPSDAPKGHDRAVTTMSHGAYPDFIYKSPVYRRFPYREDPRQPEFGSSLKNFADILWARAKDEPVRYLWWYLAGKPYYLWSWDIIQGVGDIYINPVKVSLFQTSGVAAGIRGAMKALHPLLLFLALLTLPAVISKVREGRADDAAELQLPLLPLVTCLYFTLVYMVFAPWPRYAIPLRPEFYLCGLWSAGFLLRILKKRHRSSHVPA